VLCFFEKNSQNVLTGTMTTELLDSIPLNDVKAEEGKITFGVKAISGTFQGAFAAAGERLEGTWTQRGVSHPIWLERTSMHSWSPLEGAEISVRKAPTTVRAGGLNRLIYEVHITNWSGADMTLRRVEVLLGDDAIPIEGELLRKIGRPGGAKLAPWAKTVLLVQATSDVFPAAVRHRATFQLSDSPVVRTEETGPTPVLQSVVKIDPPFAGGPWYAGSGPDSSLHHRAALTAYRGEVHLAERFAFDFSLQGGTETLFDNQSHRSYSVPVLAVADATVLSIADGLPDNVPGDLLPAIKLTGENGCGNRVTLDLGQNRYATYCHLRAGLQVKPGAKVRSGQVLGSVGNSGSSSGAHLHFQVTDGPDWLNSEGIPFEFTSFTHDGKAVTNEMPLSDWVISFLQRPQPAAQE
jgi:hypothetical protein